MTNHKISHKSYEHVLRVWEAFIINSMKDHHDLHLKFDDVLLLACVFEMFWKVLINFFELDPAHYLSTPGHSWDALLNFIDLI